MAACLVMPREHVAHQPRTLYLHLPTVAARLPALEPEVWSLEERPWFQLGTRMEVRSVRLPSTMTRGLLEELSFTRGHLAQVWTAVRRQLSGSLDAFLRHPGYDRPVGVAWRLRAGNGLAHPW